jgi:MFS family permease
MDRGMFFLGRGLSFWLLALILVLLLFAASAPSPIYREYQAALGFSSLTLTAIYGSYAVGGIATLLTTGRLSDHLGRRPVLTIALAIEAIAMLLFIGVADVRLLFAARILTGAGVGIAVGAVSAWLLDLAPPADPQLGSVVNGAGPLLGLGGGALFAAVLVEFGSDPLSRVYEVLAIVYVIAIGSLLLIPDDVRRRPGWRASMRPSIGVPENVRPIFVAACTWHLDRRSRWIRWRPRTDSLADSSSLRCVARVQSLHSCSVVPSRIACCWPAPRS